MYSLCIYIKLVQVFTGLQWQKLTTMTSICGYKWLQNDQRRHSDVISIFRKLRHWPSIDNTIRS